MEESGRMSEGAGHGFAGYGLTQYETRVQRYRVDGDRVEFVLDRTPFYAESGGEVADHGWIEGPGFAVTVDDVQRITGVTHHFGRLNSGSISLDAEAYVTASVDVERRAKKPSIILRLTSCIPR